MVIDSGLAMLDTNCPSNLHIAHIVFMYKGPTHLLSCVAHALLQEMNQVRRPKLPQRDKRLGSGINRLVEDLLGDPAVELATVRA